MNKDIYIQLLANPQEISAAHLGTLASVIDRYPYFQSARALQLKGLKNSSSFLYNDALKKTAAYTTDRDMLFSYITSKDFIQDEISKTILQHDATWNELEVDAINVSEEVSIALDNQIKDELKKAEAILNPALFEKKKQEVQSLIKTNTGLLNNASDIEDNDQNENEANEVLTLEKELKKEPLPFTKDDKHSFTEWLKLSQAKPIKRTPETEKFQENTEKENTITDTSTKFQLIEKFIQESPKISPPAKNTASTPLEIPLSEGPKTLMTETLAKVYLQQNNYEKAIQAYKILILKYPEKSGFFADQIRAIQKLTNKK